MNYKQFYNKVGKKIGWDFIEEDKSMRLPDLAELTGLGPVP